MPVGQHHHPAEPAVVVPPDVLGQLQARHVVQHPLQQNEIEGGVIEPLDGRHRIEGLNDVVARGSEPFAGPLAITGIAIDDKDTGHGSTAA